VLYHQDALNGHFRGSRFAGFFDLEMCRVGTEAMQIGALWKTLALHGIWEPFATGYALVSGRVLDDADREAARAFAHFMVWRYITRYGQWRGETMAVDHLAAEEQEAAGYREALRVNERIG
jgi:hypothetical protein